MARGRRGILYPLPRGDGLGGVAERHAPLMDAARRRNRHGWDGSAGPLTDRESPDTPEDEPMPVTVTVTVDDHQQPPDPNYHPDVYYPPHDEGDPQVVGRRRPIRDRLRDRLVDAAVARGADRAEAEAVVDELSGERPLLDWLLSGGFEKLLVMILELLGRLA